MLQTCIKPITNEVEKLQVGLSLTREVVAQLSDTVKECSEVVATHKDEIDRVAGLTHDNAVAIESVRRTLMDHVECLDKKKSEEIATLLKALDDLSKDVCELRRNHNVRMPYIPALALAATDMYRVI